MPSRAHQAVNRLLVCVAVVFASLLSPNSYAQEPIGEDAQAADPSQAASAVVRIEGLPDDVLNKGVRAIGETTNTAGFFPRSFGAARRAARRDAELFTTYLQSEGYYAAEVEARVVSGDHPYGITFYVTLGERFRVEQVKMVYTDEQAHPRPFALTDMGLDLPEDPTAATLEKTQANVLTYFRDNGYPRVRVISDRILANFSRQSAVLELSFETGPKAVFGATEWRGLDRLEQSYAETLIPWAQGDVFDLDALAQAREKLSETNLFSSIEISPGETDPATGKTPAIVTVTERSPRTIGVGGSYSTNKGPGVRIFWENRNILKRSEKLRVDLSVAQIEQELTTTLSKPFPRQQSTWSNTFAAGREDSDAFEEIRAGVSSAYAKRLSTKLSGRIGAGLEGSQLKEDGVTEDIILASFPVQLARNTVDSSLDPTKGTRLSIQATPYAGRADGFAGFGLVEVTGVFHQPLTSSRRVILSGWSRIGTTLAGSEGTVPSNKRYYAGGGGSIRGYGYQLAGPVDEDGDPEGGNAVAEFGLEMRGRVYKDVSLAAFFEGGSAFESRYPDFSERLLYGAGAGVRYHTAIGPIRVDFAVPLDRRSGIDDAFQFYISLGQAF